MLLLDMLLLVALAPVVVPQAGVLAPIDQEPIDALESVDRHAADSRGGMVVISGRDGYHDPTRFYVFDPAAPGSIRYRLTSTYEPDSIAVHEIAGVVSVDGDRFVHVVDDQWSSVTPTVVVHERSGGSWSMSRVPLPGVEYAQGRMADVSGERVAVLSTTSHRRPLLVHVVEPNAQGRWSIVQTVDSGLLSTWFEDPSLVDVDGDDIAVAQTRFGGAGRVAVLEPDPTGVWRVVETLLPPMRGSMPVVGMGLQDGVLAVVRRNVVNASFVYTLHTYRRNASGAWKIIGRAALPPTSPYLHEPWDVAVDGELVAVSHGATVRILERRAGGDLDVVRVIESAGRVAAFHSGVVVASTGAGSFGALQAIEIPPGPGVTRALSLRGLTTCDGSSSARLRVHDRFAGLGDRRVVAEITDAPVGSIAILLRSHGPGSAPAFGGSLCIDRAYSFPVGSPVPVDAAGTATFRLHASSLGPILGVDRAHHLQALVRSGSITLTNAVAWSR